MHTLCIGAGRKDKLRPGDILGALTGDAGLPGSQVGKIALGEDTATGKVVIEAYDLEEGGQEDDQAVLRLGGRPRSIACSAIFLFRGKNRPSE